MCQVLGIKMTQTKLLPSRWSASDEKMHRVEQWRHTEEALPCQGRRWGRAGGHPWER